MCLPWSSGEPLNGWRRVNALTGISSICSLRSKHQNTRHSPPLPPSPSPPPSSPPPPPQIGLRRVEHLNTRDSWQPPLYLILLLVPIPLLLIPLLLVPLYTRAPFFSSTFSSSNCSSCFSLLPPPIPHHEHYRNRSKF